jgi:hypothetical protein
MIAATFIGGAGDLDLAATLPLPLGMAGRERAPAVASRPVAPGTNPEPEITVDFVGSITNAAKVIASLHVGEKRLVFVDSRRRAEELAAALREHGIETYVSHSSPSAAERRRSGMPSRGTRHRDRCDVDAGTGHRRW